MAKELFSYEGYKIPVDLVDLTGGGTDTWDVISKGHMRQYEKYAPIHPDHTVLEVGCGVGRDAIQLSKHLSKKGRYIGTDVIKPSIEWCQKNISKKYPNFSFIWMDLYSQIHSPAGAAAVQEVKLPVKSGSVDRIVLHSVFTHMFKDDIVFYLKEFKRILKPGGLVMASFFILDQPALQSAHAKKGQTLTFLYPYGKGCYVNDADYPEGAIGYEPDTFYSMIQDSGLELHSPVRRGHWSGIGTFDDGQDIVILRPTLTPGEKLRLSAKRVKRRLAKKV